MDKAENRLEFSFNDLNEIDKSRLWFPLKREGDIFSSNTILFFYFGVDSVRPRLLYPKGK